MNNIPFPYVPYPFPYPYQNQNSYINNKNIETELTDIRKEIIKINQRLNDLEKKEINDYTKKESGMYMM